MTDEELKKLIKQKVIPALRRVSRWWKPKQDATRRQKVAPNQFKCQGCEEVYTIKEISLDHIKPVVDVKTGFVDWNTYIDRMFCGEDGFQVLCDACHTSKSQVENELRKKYRKKKVKKIK